MERLHGLAFGQQAGYLEGGALAHAVVEQVGGGVGQYAGKQTVVPIVVVRQTAHGGLYARHDDGHIGIYLFQYASVDIGGAVGTETSLSTRRVGVVVAKATGSGVVVHHTVHRPAGDSEEETRTTKLAEIAQVVAPVGLRYDGHTVASSL